MNWLIILVALIAVYVVGKIIQFRHIKHRIFAIAMILIALFLYLTISGVVKSNDIDIKTAKGVFEAGKVYALWLGEAFSNAKIITGNVISVVKSAGNHNSTITGKVSSSQGSGSSGSSNAGKVPRLS